MNSPIKLPPRPPMDVGVSGQVKFAYSQEALDAYAEQAVREALAAVLVPDEWAAFELKFPVPDQCMWTGNGYAATDYNAWNAHKHASRWEGWKARAALASAPPKEDNHEQK